VDTPAAETPSVRFKLSTKGSDRSPRLGDGEDPAAVLEAIAALRDRGDAVRASALLAEHLRAHPRGVLAEDALALAIEAAIARHDTRAAGDLGRRYLTQYPNGRYRAFASRATEP
jgi:outer membrane protein assembly factor BamD (BamD/ComL family)